MSERQCVINIVHDRKLLLDQRCWWLLWKFPYNLVRVPLFPLSTSLYFCALISNRSFSVEWKAVFSLLNILHCIVITNQTRHAGTSFLFQLGKPMSSTKMNSYWSLHNRFYNIIPKPASPLTRIVSCPPSVFLNGKNVYLAKPQMAETHPDLSVVTLWHETPWKLCIWLYYHDSMSTVHFDEVHIQHLPLWPVCMWPVSRQVSSLILF